MAKITPIDIIKGVSGKFGGGNSKEYFATNKCRKRLNSCIILMGHYVNVMGNPLTMQLIDIQIR